MTAGDYLTYRLKYGGIDDDAPEVIKVFHTTHTSIKANFVWYSDNVIDATTRFLLFINEEEDKKKEICLPKGIP